MQKYSIDTSAILDAWVRHYPHDIFPSFWNRFKSLAKSQVGIATELIDHELGKKDDGCHKWFKENNLSGFFVELTDSVQNAVSDILKNPNYQRLIEDRKGAYRADPFVIALAKVEDLIVVTGEKATNNLNKPKIPDVCKDMGIECINILDLMRREGWQF
ncbi:MAG: DUF4411 family protein [Bacteroidetes bacterium]|nr:DUF4411 family protein [Bacteroidota bacterium]